MLVEGHLAQVGTHADAGVAAAVVVGGQFDHYGPVGPVGIDVGDAVSQAHLAGADPFDLCRLKAWAIQDTFKPSPGDL